MDLRERGTNPHRHPWELSRADKVLGLLAGNPRNTTYADIGSGDLYFARRLSELTDARVYAVDVHYGAPGEDGPIRLCTELEQVPSHVVGCAVLMDVLEHVADDVALVDATGRILTRDGRAVVTVPAHAFLWSEHDVLLGHQRRYDRAGLRRVLHRGGFDVLECFYFYALPFAARAASVLLARARRGGPRPGAVAAWAYPAEHPVTKGLRALLNGDFAVSRLLGGAVWGLSICAICRRRSA